jgi:hypothetical protein
MLVSGMIVGTAFTLFVVPSIYVLVARRRAAVVPDVEDVEVAHRTPGMAEAVI